MQLALKIDFDTERGTRIGIPNLLKLFDKLGIKATFLFAMGPDNTGRAIRRIFRPGFFSKVSRTSVVSVYGIRTLLNGILLPGPQIAKKHADLMRQVKDAGHEVGIHCYDHVFWHDNLHKISEAKVRYHVNKAVQIFKSVFGFLPKTMGAAGWQANKYSLSAYDDHNLLYASDTRGREAFFPIADKKTFKTLQIPTTLPTLDELLGRPEYPTDSLINHYLDWIKPETLNVFTLHAELEGMKYLDWFEQFLTACIDHGIQPVPMQTIAEQLLANSKDIPSLKLVQGTVDGRSGTLAKHS